jgi:hypothetical protein
VLELIPAGSVTQQCDAETALAELLVDRVPHSDSLLEPAIQCLGWQEQANALVLDPTVQAVLARWDERTLAAFRSGSDPDSAVFRRLTWSSIPLRSRVRVLFSERACWPEHVLLRRLRRDHPELLPELDAGAVRWWERRGATTLSERWLPPAICGVVFVFTVIILLARFS